MIFKALINFCFVTGFFFIFMCEALPHRGLLHTILPSFTYSRICCGYLPREYTVGICCGYWPWFFCICKQILFCIYDKSCFHKRKPFLYESKSFLFVILPLLTVFLFVIHVAVMSPGHSIYETFATYLKISPKNYVEQRYCNEEMRII